MNEPATGEVASSCVDDSAVPEVTAVGVAQVMAGVALPTLTTREELGEGLKLTLPL